MNCPICESEGFNNLNIKNPHKVWYGSNEHHIFYKNDWYNLEEYKDKLFLFKRKKILNRMIVYIIL